MERKYSDTDRRRLGGIEVWVRRSVGRGGSRDVILEPRAFWVIGPTRIKIIWKKFGTRMLPDPFSVPSTWFGRKSIGWKSEIFGTWQFSLWSNQSGWPTQDRIPGDIAEKFRGNRVRGVPLTDEALLKIGRLQGQLAHFPRVSISLMMLSDTLPFYVKEHSNGYWCVN